MPITRHARSACRSSVALAGLFLAVLTAAAPSTAVMLGWFR